MDKLSINYDENVMFYIVDKNDDENYYNNLPEDEKAALDTANEKWIADHLTPKLMTLVGFCPCRMPAVMERTQRRAMLAAVPPGSMIGPSLEQEDIDAYRFVVVVVADHDKYEDISLIIRECKVCSKLDFWGDATMLGGQLANLINDAYTLAEFKVSPVEDPEPETIDTTAEHPLGEGVAFEDLDTGEWSEGDGDVTKTADDADFGNDAGNPA